MENWLDRPLKKHWRHRWNDKEWQHGYQRVLIDLEALPSMFLLFALGVNEYTHCSSRFPANKEKRCSSMFVIIRFSSGTL